MFDDFKRALGLHDTSPWSTAIEPARHGQLEIIDGVVSVTSEHDQQFNGVRVW